MKEMHSTGGYKLTKSQENINPPNVRGRYQTICQKRKRIGNSIKQEETKEKVLKKSIKLFSRKESVQTVSFSYVLTANDGDDDT